MVTFQFNLADRYEKGQVAKQLQDDYTSADLMSILFHVKSVCKLN